MSETKDLALLTPMQRARQEWEQQTTPCPKIHYIGNKAHRDEFRRYGQAIAWLEWDGEYIEIKKIEALQTRQGAAKPLVEFLKRFADEYGLRLFGNAVVYPPDPPVPVGPVLSQEELEQWYKKQGFRLQTIEGTNIKAIWYPDAPSSRYAR